MTREEFKELWYNTERDKIIVIAEEERKKKSKKEIEDKELALYKHLKKKFEKK